MVVVRRYASRVGSWRWIATLAALNGIVALAIDMSLPAQPTLATTFRVSAETAALNLSLFMVPFAIVQVFIGYLSDAIGRRPVMLGGLGVFTIAGLACALSPTIEVLLVCRAIQGAGAAACPVVARAMIRDTQPPGQAARLLSTMLATLAIAPMLAPTLGSALMHAFNWRAIYSALATCGIALLLYASSTLDETLPVARRTAASFRGLGRGFARFFRARGTKFPVIISSASFAGLFAYVAGSPFVLVEGYGVPVEHYGFYFALTAVAIMFGSITGGRMLHAGRSPGTMIVIGASIQVVAGGLVIAGTVTGMGLAGFLGPIMLYFVGSGITSPSSMALAMEPLPELAGTASSAVGSSAMISGAIAAYATTKMGASSPAVFAGFMAVMGAIVFVFAVLAAVLRQKQHESR
ncbi:MAG: multidrug effflux MFS transporter [Myxococcota bacterium]|nr:multidrug effflux MFS transporter [Myxococcota bacterium]